MPMYDFECRACKDDVIWEKTMRISEYHRPPCPTCSAEMTQLITQPPSVFWKDPLMDAINMPTLPGNPVINNMKERRELMARHDMVDCEYTPPTHAEQTRTHKEVMKSIDEISVPDDVARELDIV